MLYLLHRGNHQELSYHGGQEPILHLEFDFDELSSWADSEGRPWAFTTENAAAYYSQFCSERKDLIRIDWVAVNATDWRAEQIREHKQAEFLVFEQVPWSLVHRIGVHDISIYEHVMRIRGSASKPLVEVLPRWYY
jgi:hypothetical protein